MAQQIELPVLQPLPGSGGLSFWDYVRKQNQDRTAKHRPDDQQADQAAAALIQGMSAQERAAARAVAEQIMDLRQQAPNSPFLAINVRDDGALVPMGDPTIVFGIKHIIEGMGSDASPALQWEGLTLAMEVEVGRIIDGRDLTAYGIE